MLNTETDIMHRIINQQQSAMNLKSRPTVTGQLAEESLALIIILGCVRVCMSGVINENKDNE